MSRSKTSGRRRSGIAAWFTVAAGWLMGTAAWAQQTQMQGFQSISDVPDSAREQLPSSPFVYAAYGFVWVALIVYVFLLWRRLGKVERELADVSSRLGARR